MSQATELKFRKMTAWQKCVFVCKVGVFVLTAGFVYPNILLD